MPVPGLNYRLCGHPLCRRNPAACTPRRAARDPHANRRRATASGSRTCRCCCRAPTTAMSTGRRRTLVWCAGQRPRPRCLAESHAGNRGADRHLLPAAARRLSRPGRAAGRPAGVRARARAPVSHASFRGRARPYSWQRRSEPCWPGDDRGGEGAVGRLRVHAHARAHRDVRAGRRRRPRPPNLDRPLGDRDTRLRRGGRRAYGAPGPARALHDVLLGAGVRRLAGGAAHRSLVRGVRCGLFRCSGSSRSRLPPSRR